MMKEEIGSRFVWDSMCVPISLEKFTFFIFFYCDEKKNEANNALHGIVMRFCFDFERIESASSGVRGRSGMETEDEMETESINIVC